MYYTLILTYNFLCSIENGLIVESTVLLDENGLKISEHATDTSSISYTAEATTNKMAYICRVSSNSGVQDHHLELSSDPHNMITQTATASITPTVVSSREKDGAIETTKTTAMLTARFCT